MTINKDDYLSPLRPRMKLFLSADIVGSTAYKQPFDMRTSQDAQNSLDDAQLWQNAIQEFYTEITLKFEKTWQDWEEKLKDSPGFNQGVAHLVAGEKPHFWKTVGDEVIFWKELGHECQIWLVLHCWLDAVVHVRAKLKKSRLSLDVKSTLWVAEFPVRNRALFMGYANPKGTTASDPASFTLKSGEEGIEFEASELRKLDWHGIKDYYEKPEFKRRTVDFVGPGIDVGFRVAGFSSLKRMAISVDTAYILSLAGYVYEKSNRSGHNKEDQHFVANWKVGRSFCDTLLISTELSIGSAKPISRSITEIKVHFSGTQSLKGVLGGIKYPLFWINMTGSESFEAEKEKLYIHDHGQRPVLEWETLRNFCKSFYEDRDRYLSPPIIVPKSQIEELESDWSESHETRDVTQPENKNRKIYLESVDRMWEASGLETLDTSAP
jgi:hypothetical protein